MSWPWVSWCFSSTAFISRGLGGEAGDELGRQPGSRCLRTAILISWAGDLKHVASYELVAASQETSEEDEEGF